MKRIRLYISFCLGLVVVAIVGFAFPSIKESAFLQYLLLAASGLFVVGSVTNYLLMEREQLEELSSFKFTFFLTLFAVGGYLGLMLDTAIRSGILSIKQQMYTLGFSLILSCVFHVLFHLQLIKKNQISKGD